MNSKLIGGVLLMVGCTIGAGILGLPVATAELGFAGSVALLVAGWLVITICAFLVLEVTMWLPEGTNLISMAGATLGKWGQAFTWIIYLVLLYSFICAYIAGGGDLFHYLLQVAGFTVSLQVSTLLFTVLFGFIVYLGMRTVDYTNRALMFVKLSAFLALVFSALPFVSAIHLNNHATTHFVTPSSMMVTAAAFGSLMIIPSLRTYFNGDIKSLRKAIVIGFLISLFCYIAWDMVIMGVIPWGGALGLEQLTHSQTTNSDILKALDMVLHKPLVMMFAQCFTSICMTTSFLSISLCLTDFLSDGLRMPKRGVNNLMIHGVAFIPPVLIVLFYPGGFMRALEYAGICIVVLMILMPPLMVWRGRYHCKFTEECHQGRAAYNKVFLVTMIVFAMMMLGLGLKSA